MKAKGLILAMCLLVAFSASAEKVRGNGNVITKEINVGSFETIDAGGNVSFEKNGFNLKQKKEYKFIYSQRSGKESLSVTMDENLFSYLEIRSTDGKLTIRTKDRDKIIPTTLIIKGSSENLKKVSLSGSLDFIAETPIKSDELSISVSGAGDVLMAKQTDVESIKFTISGAGDVIASDLRCKRFEGKVSGAGDIEIKGKSDEAKFSVSGAGDIEAYDFIVKNVTASVSGVGDIEVYASETLNASVSGIGDIAYKGNPEVSSKKSGMGSIKKK